MVVATGGVNVAGLSVRSAYDPVNPVITPPVIVIVVPSTLTAPDSIVLAVGKEDQLVVVPSVYKYFPALPATTGNTVLEYNIFNCVI